MLFRSLVLALLVSLLGGSLVLSASAPLGQGATTQPVFQVDHRNPTQDKPQSKLWFAHDTWWALLPTVAGPSLWQRSPAGWSEQGAVRLALAGLPGRCDVWFDGDGVTAVGVEPDRLAVLRLRSDGKTPVTWQAEKLAAWTVPTFAPIETATIARDATGMWWVTAPITPADVAPVKPKDGAKATKPRAVMVWYSTDGRTWTALPPLATGIGGDDICLMTAVEGGVGVAWSDQNRDEVVFRRHRDGHPPAEWESGEIIASGGLTADDHLNAALADGRLWLATKNSVDTAGQPQLVLRVRSAAGRWLNFPYGVKAAGATPSRPIAVATPDGRSLLLGQTNYTGGDSTHDSIAFGVIGVGDTAIAPVMTTVIAPDPALKAKVNDVTGPKAAFPASGPWIVLASDTEGRVYEADVRPPVAAAGAASFRFTVTSDPHLQPANYDKVLAAMQRHSGGPGEFQVVVGDLCDKPGQTPQALRDRVDARFGREARWFAVMGNHDAAMATQSEAMTWRRDEFNAGHGGRPPLRTQAGVRPGPPGCEETTYSWDQGNAHFVVLNPYWDGGTAPGSDAGRGEDGDVGPALLAWLERDLAANTKPFVFVFGHEPAFPRYRHVGDSLDRHPENRDAFWRLLARHGVQAYFCGHVHSYFKEQRDGVWQICDGHAGRVKGGDRIYLDVQVGPAEAEVRTWIGSRDNWTDWKLLDTIRLPAAAAARVP